MEVQRSAPLYQQVCRFLRQQILGGQYKPGEVLLESHIAAALNVSRTPVREALRQLERERLIVLRKSELVVANPSREEFVHLYTCRAMLERLVARRAAELATPEDVEIMHAALEDSKTAILAGDHQGVFDANTRFHDAMTVSARMPVLSELMETIRGPILVARRHVLGGSRKIENTVLREHRAILEAIRGHDRDGAEESIALHMRNDIERGVKNFDVSC